MGIKEDRPIISDCHQRSKIRSNFKFGEGDAGLWRCKMHIKEDALRSQIGSQVRSNLRLLGLSSNLGRVMLDQGQMRIKEDALQGQVRSNVRSNFK